MNADAKTIEDLLLFDEQMPVDSVDSTLQFKSECPPDKKFKAEDLFMFRRGRGDLNASVFAALVALIFLALFWTETGWENRKLPDNVLGYLGHQFGLLELEGRVRRLGSILKQSWVVPLLCLIVLVPAALMNLRDSYRIRQWRQRFLLPTDSSYETEKYLAALEYVAYFILYTVSVPVLGYLVSTLLLGVYLTWRLGYRTPRWLFIGLLSSLAIVIVFRSFLKIKTPINIWLYDQLPAGMRVFMLTYF